MKNPVSKKVAVKKTAAVKKAVKKTAVKKVVEKVADKLTKGEFKVVVETGGNVYEAKSDDVASALLSFGIKHTNTKTKFTISKGDKVREFTHFRPQALRILKNEMAARFFARNVEKYLQ